MRIEGLIFFLVKHLDNLVIVFTNTILVEFDFSIL